MTVFSPVLRSNKHRAQRGVSLFELLLVVGVMAMMMAIGTSVVSSLTRQTANQIAAQQILRVQTAAKEFVKANFASLIDTTIPALGSTTTLTVQNLIDANYLPAGTTVNNALGLSMRVYLRNDTNVAAGSLAAIQVVTVTEPVIGGDLGRPIDWLQDTAAYGSGSLGLITNQSATTALRLTSYTNKWRINIASLPGYTPALPVVGTDIRGYLAAQDRMTSEDIFDGDVMYRVAVAGQPEHNQMETNLNMGGFDLTDVGTITSDRMTVTGAMTLDNGSNYALTSQDTLTLGGTTTANGGMNIYSDANAGTTDLRVAGNLAMNDGTLSTSSYQSNTLAAGADGLVSNNVTTNNTNSGDLVTNTTATLNNISVFTSNIQLGAAAAGNPTITSASVRATTAVTARARISGNLNLAAGATGNAARSAHSVISNARIGGSTVLPSVTATEAYFEDLCYNSGAAEGLDGC